MKGEFEKSEAGKNPVEQCAYTLSGINLNGAELPYMSGDWHQCVVPDATTAANNLSFIEPHEEEEAKALIEKHLGFKPRNKIRIPGFCILVKIWYPEEHLTMQAMDKKEESRIITPENPFPGSNKLNSLEEKLGQIRKSNIILPESALFFEKCRSCTALVIDIGPGAYKGERFADWQNGFPKVGDWVIIPKNEGNRIVVKDKGNKFDMVIIYDDKIKGIVCDPSDVEIQM